MRKSDIMFIIWFVVAISLDKFINIWYYYDLVLLILSGIFLYLIHRFNMAEKVDKAEKTQKAEKNKVGE